MAYFVCELDDKAKLDIRKRLVNLKGCFDIFSDEDINRVFDEKINIAIPELEWQEYLYFDLSLEWIDDDEFISELLERFCEYQDNRRKVFGYDY